MSITIVGKEISWSKQCLNSYRVCLLYHNQYRLIADGLRDARSEYRTVYRCIMREDASTRIGVVLWQSCGPRGPRPAFAPWGCDVRGRSIGGATSPSPIAYPSFSSYPADHKHDPPYASFTRRYRLITPQVSNDIDTISHTNSL